MWTMFKLRESQLNFDNSKSNNQSISCLQSALDVQLFLSKSYLFDGDGGSLCKSTHSNSLWQIASDPSLEFNVTWQTYRKRYWIEDTRVVDRNRDARQGNQHGFRVHSTRMNLCVFVFAKISSFQWNLLKWSRFNDGILLWWVSHWSGQSGWKKQAA